MDKVNRAEQDVTPRMHLTDSDFVSFSHRGALCSPNGELGPNEFERVMREQVSLLPFQSLNPLALPWPPLQPPALFLISLFPNIF